MGKGKRNFPKDFSPKRERTNRGGLERISGGLEKDEEAKPGDSGTAVDLHA